jgi:hypothetical protein
MGMRGRGDFSSRGDGRGGGFGGRGKLKIFYGMICRGDTQNSNRLCVSAHVCMRWGG